MFDSAEFLALRVLTSVLGCGIGWSCEVCGELPATRPLIFAANHPTDYDAWFALPAIRQRLGEWPALLAWPGLRKLPVLRKLEHFSRCPAIVVDHGNPVWPLAAKLKQGRSVYLTPEGASNSRLGAFHAGAALLSMRSGALIVPCRMDVDPGRFGLVRSFHFQEPVDPREASHLPFREGVAHLLARLRDSLVSTMPA